MGCFSFSLIEHTFITKKVSFHSAGSTGSGIGDSNPNLPPHKCSSGSIPGSVPNRCCETDGTGWGTRRWSDTRGRLTIAWTNTVQYSCKLTWAVESTIGCRMSASSILRSKFTQMPRRRALTPATHKWLVRGSRDRPGWLCPRWHFRFSYPLVAHLCSVRIV